MQPRDVMRSGQQKIKHFDYQLFYIYIYNIIKLKKKIYIVVRCYQLFNIYEDINFFKYINYIIF